MALIMSDYWTYFIYGRGNELPFKEGKVSYFDPVERVFLRITPSKGEVPAEHWIRLPVIREVDAVKSYLRLTDETTFLQDYAELDDIAFCAKIAESMSRNYTYDRSYQRMWGYVNCYYNERILKWLQENDIPNCWLEPLRSELAEKGDAIETKEDIREWFECAKAYRRREAQQEAEFKRQLRAGSAQIHKKG